MKKINMFAALLALSSIGMSAQESVPYEHVFDNPNCLEGWTTDLGSLSFKYLSKGVYPLGVCPKAGGAISKSITSTSGHLTKNTWLISPAFALEAGKSYNVKYTVASTAYTLSLVEVYYGTAPTIEAMNTFVARPNPGPQLWGQGFNNEADFSIIEGDIKPQTSGVYYIGFMDNSPRESNGDVVIFDFSITSAASGAMPAEPTNFTVTPSPVGALSVTLSATAPTLDVQGADLTSLTALEFLRGETVIHSVSNPEKGKTYTYTDLSPINGNNRYSVRAVNDEGNSDLVSETVKVGLEIPQALTDVNAGQISAGKVKFSWEKPIGDIFQTMFQDPSLVTTKIVISEGSKVVKTLENVPGTEVTVDFDANADLEQVFYSAVLYAVTSGGESLPVSVIFPVGKISVLPYSENFADGKVHNPFFVGDAKYGGAWQYLVENNEGVARFSANASSGTATLYSGSIAIPEDSHENLSFKYLGTSSNSDHTLTVLINSDGKWKEVEAYKVNNTEWLTSVIDLSAYAGKNIQYALRGRLGTGGYNFTVSDIEINSAKDYDLGIDAVNFPASMEKGLPAEATVTVKNFGTKAVDSYKVKLYIVKDQFKELADTKTCGPIESWDSEVVTFDITPANTAPAKMTYYVEIEYESDQDAENNKSGEIEVSVITPSLVPVANLTVEMNDNETVVNLKWDAPEGADPDSPSTYHKLLGYRVIRNGAAVNADPMQACEFVDDQLAPGTYTYKVAAVYEAGIATSQAVSAVVKDASQVGIDSITADELDGSAVYYDLLGRKVANPVAGSIYIKVVNGKAQRVLVK